MSSFLLAILIWAARTEAAPSDSARVGRTVTAPSGPVMAAARDSALAPVEGTTPDSSSLARHASAWPFLLVPVATLPDSADPRGPLTQPAGVASDAFGSIYVTDAALHRLQRYDSSGRWLGEAGALGSGQGGLRRPAAVAPLGTLRMAVLDRENRRIVTYDLFGRLEGTLVDLAAPGLEAEVGRVDPIDLAAERGGNFYVADAERDRILAFDFSGRFVRTLGGFGARPGSFRGLSGIAVGRRGELIAAERANARLQRLDPGGRVLATWPLRVEPRRAALAVAADDSGRVAVADEASGELWVFSITGVSLAHLSGLDGPRAVAFHRDGTLLVAESGASRVRRFRIDRTPEPPVPPGR